MNTEENELISLGTGSHIPDGELISSEDIMSKVYNTKSHGITTEGLSQYEEWKRLELHKRRTSLQMKCSHPFSKYIMHPTSLYMWGAHRETEVQWSMLFRICTRCGLFIFMPKGGPFSYCNYCARPMIFSGCREVHGEMSEVYTCGHCGHVACKPYCGLQKSNPC